MKKLAVFAVLFVSLFSLNGCSTGSGDEIVQTRIYFFVDGFRKDLYNITIDQNNPDFLHVRGQLGSDIIESLEFDVIRNQTGTSAVSNMIFTQANVQYYSFSGVFINVTENDEDRVIRGQFSGTFRTLSGDTKIITDGRFIIRY